MSSGFNLVGLRDLQDQLVELGELLGKPTQPLQFAGRRAWQPILAAARALCPRSTQSLNLRSASTAEKQAFANYPHLRDAIMITVKKPKQGDVVLTVGLKIRKMAKGASVAGVNNPRRRWHLVEFGTSKMAAKPYIRPAFDQAHRQALQIFMTELSKATTRAIGKRGITAMSMSGFR